MSKRPEKLKCRPGYVQQGSACKPIRAPKPKTTSSGKVAKTVATALVGAAVVGAGATAIASHNSGSFAPQPPAPDPLPPPTPPQKLNKAAIATGAVAAAGAIGAGAAIMASRNQPPKPPPPAEKWPVGAKVEYKQVPDPWDEEEQPKGAGASAVQKRKSQSQSQKPEYKSVEDPWNGEAPPSEASKGEGDRPVAAGQAILEGRAALKQLPPPVNPVTSRSPAQKKQFKEQLKTARTRQKRTNTELEKAENKLELGRSLQEKESDADKMRGLDYELASTEKIANLKARSPERTPAGLAVIRGKNRGQADVRTEPAEESHNRKKKKDRELKSKAEREQAIAEAQAELDRVTESSAIAESPDETQSPTKKTGGSKLSEERQAKIRERKRKERSENREFAEELGKTTVKSATGYVMKGARKNALNTVVPGLGDAVEKVDRFWKDKTRLEQWADDLENSADTSMSRRQFFRKSGQFAAKQTARKPSTATQELKRGAEVAKDFFDKLAGDSDQIILRGSRQRGFGSGGNGGRAIKLSKKEFDRITRDYTDPQRRSLRNFLDFIGFPLP